MEVDELLEAVCCSVEETQPVEEAQPESEGASGEPELLGLADCSTLREVLPLTEGLLEALPLTVELLDALRCTVDEAHPERDAVTDAKLLGLEL
jgi:hypothetical protein